MNLQINLPNTTYENICTDKFSLSDIPELINAIKSGKSIENDNCCEFITSSTSSETIRIPKTSEISIGDQIEFPIGVKIYTATAIQEESNGGVLFIFDDIIGRSSMDSIQSFLDKFYQRLPEDLKSRMNGNNLRLLDASEVFYKNVPDEWEWLTENTQVQVENPPISYFARRDFRACGASWWLRSVASPSYFACVDSDGIVGDYHTSCTSGVRPAFAIY